MNNNTTENKKDEIVFEICFKITNKDYKLTLATRKAWVVGIVLILLRIFSQYWEKL